jgi:glycosyltransferase involved in cell wall biosynthesis
MKSNITVLIHTCNEEKNIKECINSSQLLTKDTVVIDMESQDNTIRIAKQFGVKIYTFPKSDYVEPARKFGIEKTQAAWVFILDADERITEELAKEIRLVISQSWSRVGQELVKNAYYKIPRKNIFGKVRWLKYGGWWPDYQIRLIKKEAFIDWSKEIHSTPKIKGKCGFLKNPILHYFHGDLEKMVEKTAVFEDIESDLLFKGSRNVNICTFFKKFLGELYRRLIKNLGFLDGTLGIIESIYQAFSKTITYIFLYEKQVRLVEKKLKSRSL